MSGPREVAPGVFLLEDTCNVYVVRAAPHPDSSCTGIAIDFGSGAVLDHLAEMGIDRLTDVLMTHHHRDQAQGLPRAVEHGIAIHVPAAEQDLFAHVDEMWRTRPLFNDYNLRQDRFSLLEPVPIADTVPEYRKKDYHGVTVDVHATPGHTPGSVTYIVERGGQRIAFTGDLIYAPGKVWSLAATQWSYTENEGPAMTVISCYLLLRARLDLLLPSHGEPMPDPIGALDLLARRMQAYVDQRRPYPWELRARLHDPFFKVTPHLLLNRSSIACTYVLLSETGAALLIDFGYDMTTGLPPGPDRAARRPWLGSLPALRRKYDVRSIEVALVTHYHDDHVAGLNLLREVEGTDVWAPSTVAPIMADPMQHDLPCQWYDPIPVDRELALGETVRWHEYEITVHDLPGHTRYHCGYEFVVDGVRVLVTGDQQEGLGIPGDRRDMLNYQYRNVFRPEDYRASAALYRKVAPGIIATGHWDPRWVDEAYLQMLEDEAEEMIGIHRDLLPDGPIEPPADGVMARWTPYYSRVEVSGQIRGTVTVRNPFGEPVRACVRPVLPPSWTASQPVIELEIAPNAEAQAPVLVTVGPEPQDRARMALDVTIGDLRLGQHADAVVDVVEGAAQGTPPEEPGKSAETSSFVDTVADTARGNDRGAANARSDQHLEEARS